MGIPQLITTLEPYAINELLQDYAVVIDGPALAYHIFHACRSNGVNHPSCRLLGESVVAWLDQLTSTTVAVEAIYFDGHLPADKLPVRMERVVQSTSRSNHFYSANAEGCPLSDISSESSKPLDLFELRGTSKRPVIAPPFLVPAVIEALGSSPRYQALISLVPGEADAYCAQRLSQRGGVVLTSDSDLLAHNIGNGRVAFFRDLYLDAMGRVACAMFCPRRIAQRIGPRSSNDLCRLAYERKRSWNASLAQLKQACSLPVANDTAYSEFCRQYVEHEVSPLPVSVNGDTISLNGLDPRVCELVLQLGQSKPGSDHNGGDPRVFLTHLVDSQARGSAWEQSLSIRQLAYTVARWIIPGNSCSVQEYRRVQSVDQRGRQVGMIPQSSARDCIDAIVEIMHRLEELMPGYQATYWIMLCLVLDIRENNLNGKSSLALRTLQSPPATKTSSRVPWDVMHLAANIQAGLYSLRILNQVLTLAPSGEAGLPPSNIAQLRDALSRLPPLAQYPGAHETLRFIREASSLRVMQTLGEFVHIPSPQGQASGDSFKVQKKKKKTKKQTNKPHGTAEKAMASANMFGLLATD